VDLVQKSEPVAVGEIQINDDEERRVGKTGESALQVAYDLDPYIQVFFEKIR
jgi:hypothetical protein